MSFKSKRKSKSKKVYIKKTRRKYSKKRVKNRVTRKQKVMRGGDRNQIQLLGLARNLQNAMFEINKKNFLKRKQYLNLDSNPTIKVSEFITEKNIDIVGSDFDPIRGEALQYVLKWHYDNLDNDNPPWQKFIGKLCEVPPNFFTNGKPDANVGLHAVKQNPDNFNPDFPRDLTNVNIVEIPFNILDYANDKNQAVDTEFVLIPRGKYKFALMTKNKNIRYVADTGTHNPYYHFPSIILYFYNQGIITFEELKGYLGNEIPHSFLFNPRRETIMGAGDFTVDATGYIVELTGYSGHTKPLPSNVAYSADKFKKLGYPLEFVETKPIRLQTGNTNRNDNNDRLIGTYYNMKYSRPKTVDEDEDVAAATAAASQAMEEEEEEEDI